VVSGCSGKVSGSPLASASASDRGVTRTSRSWPREVAVLLKLYVVVTLCIVGFYLVASYLKE
jgi:hypothetical protein